MVDVRRIIVIFVVAVLFTILVNVSIDAFYQPPEYHRYCTESTPKLAPPLREASCEPYQPRDGLLESCTPERGEIRYRTDSNGCPIEAFCDPCSVRFELAQSRYNFIVFTVSAVAGLLALITGLFLPRKKNIINEWVGSGFLLGGLLTIFVGTARYFGDMGRAMRPVVILLELVLFLYLTYRWLGSRIRKR